jgi:aquaporin related protein
VHPPAVSAVILTALSFGFSLLVVAWVFFRVSGAAFNPASKFSPVISFLDTKFVILPNLGSSSVTLALWLVGSMTFRRAMFFFIAQLVGGIAAAGVAKGLTLGSFSVVDEITSGLSAGRALAIEMLTTGLLVLTVLMMIAEKHQS